jgi:polyhydroxyalkanoate synthase
MANTLFDKTLEQQKTWFEQALAQQKAVYDQTLKMWSRMFAIPRITDAAREVKIATTPFDVVYEEDTLRLLHYRRDTPAAYAEPILFCYALVNRPYIVDLQHERSVIRQFLARGFDVYLIDWGVPSAAHRSMMLRDYIDGLLKHCADFVARESTTSRFHLVGYCMGGTMSAIYTARYPWQAKTLTLMTAPIDFSVGADQSLVQFWTNPDYFDVDSLIDAYGNVPAEFLQASFQMMKPVQNYFMKYVNFFEKMDDDQFVENYLAMERWTNDNIPLAGETFREFVTKLYQRNELVKGEYRLAPGEDPVQLSRITCPLMLLTASADHLVPPSQTEGIVPYVGTRDVKSVTLNAGHIGLAVSTKAHKTFWPEATRWIADRSTPPKP